MVSMMSSANYLSCKPNLSLILYSPQIGLACYAKLTSSICEFCFGEYEDESCLLSVFLLSIVAAVDTH